jgi:hypothetical protein
MTEIADVPSKRASTTNVKTKYNNYCNTEIHDVDFPDQYLLHYNMKLIVTTGRRKHCLTAKNRGVRE